MIHDSATTSAAPQKPAGNRLGRTALFVMVAGLLTSCAMLAVVLFVGGSNAQIGNQDLLPVANMALAIGGVLYCWSLILAIRALKQGEHSTLPLWVFNLATLPPAVFGFIWWFPSSNGIFQSRRWAFSVALPVILPFIAFTFVSGTLLLRPLFNLVERRRKRIGKPDFTRTQRIIRVTLMCICYAILLGVAILPVSFRVLNEIDYSIHRDVRRFAWNNRLGTMPTESKANGDSWLAKQYSDFINDKAERLLSLAPNGEWRHAQFELLNSGDLPFQRLRDLTFAADRYVAEGAFQGIEMGYPELATDTAFELIGSCRNGTLKTIPSQTFVIVARNGSFEQRRILLESMLDTPLKLDLSYLRFVDQIPRDVRFVPTYRAILKINSRYHLLVLDPLLEYLTDQEAQAELDDLWKSNAPATQRTIQQLSSRGGRTGTLCFGIIMDQTPLATRRETLNLRFRHAFNRQEAHFIKLLIKLLENDDLTLRRGSATMLVQTLNFDNQLLDEIRPMFRPSKGGATNYGEAPTPATPEEFEAIKVIREKAEAWVAEHQKGLEK